jgi:predicted nucleic acid-binding protein
LIIVDASLMIAWLLQEDDVLIVPDVYQSLPERDILVPSHWPVEVANALLSNVRRRRIAIEKVDSILEALGVFRINVDAPMAIEQMGDLTHFAASQKLTVYDASYVQLAFEENVPLATLDQDMRMAARHLNIALVPGD